MTRKYTAGPWAVFILADDTETYGNIAGMPIVTADDDNSEVCGACANPADAHLIAAAPDMLDALKGIESTFVFLDSLTAGWEPQHTNCLKALAAVRAAIAKAEGT